LGGPTGHGIECAAFEFDVEDTREKFATVIGLGSLMDSFVR
jgi:hypothetical protein